jgi:hypothetical protein
MEFTLDMLTSSWAGTTWPGRSAKQRQVALLAASRHYCEFAMLEESASRNIGG